MSPEIPKSRQDRGSRIILRQPAVADGIRLWEIARDSQVLDTNSSYAYVLWCHDFSTTSIVAEHDGRPVGFVTGYRRPDRPDVLMVWQVAVDADQRGGGIAASMLTGLFERCRAEGVSSMQTTISPDNVASQRLFTGVAKSLGLDLKVGPLFAATDFPDAHLREDLYDLAAPSQSE
ncbi:L-2,4-diaminobutyric acid acetyltransferase [Gordonia hirsuta DSM 44140 = NBRC 16056]|uniref:L-2,4-diaminobutyric acid acetyltransferase n=1 Tax=Gordonia hirsuta DSM 44140 = NBRC 16056 TaxID=1121927 RepID=L7LFH2_9ACTN|nr:diaminobutyrate acetyltransferase [Gordonia hirsuta]GAC58832.1 L-2,4-diaminobutyric acid acetyltransferase [Gordonia hirsuta DSM 44140 = NBRC 16056]